MNKHEKKFRDDVEKKYGKDAYDLSGMVYVNQHTDITLYCNQGEHQFTITPMHMVRKTSRGCNVCQKNTAYTLSEFITIVSKNYPYLTFENTVYVPQRKGNMTVTCHKDSDNPHEWVVNSKTLLLGKTQCGVCSGKGGYTQEQFVKVANQTHNNIYDYSMVKYTGSENRVCIICKLHGEFHQQPKAHLSGRGCPECGNYGYQPSKPGTFYIQKLKSVDKVLYKFGITGNLERRIHEQSRNSIYDHELFLQMDFDDGKIPLAMENEIKDTITYGIITESELPSGFTETFGESELEKVLEILKKYEGEQ